MLYVPSDWEDPRLTEFPVKLTISPSSSSVLTSNVADDGIDDPTGAAGPLIGGGIEIAAGNASSETLGNIGNQPVTIDANTLALSDAMLAAADSPGNLLHRHFRGRRRERLRPQCLLLVYVPSGSVPRALRE